MASGDARPLPLKNTAMRITFPILDADGDLVTGATGLDSEVSINAGTFADCTNEATEIATASGMYYLDLTSSEMNGDTIAVIVKTSSSGAKTSTFVMYPAELGDHNVIADDILLRNVSNTEATAGEHTLTTLVLAALEWSISGSTLTIYRTNGSTTHATKTLTSSAVNPVTSVA
jgi:hypothetical protein